MQAKIKAFLSSLSAEIKDTWERSKMYVFAALALIAALEFRRIYEAVLVSMGQRDLKKAKEKDDDQKAKEDSLNAQADSYVKKAQETAAGTTVVTDPDWDRKQ